MTQSTPVLNDKRIITGWALFDWANSAYFLVIATAIFPIYYTSVTDDHVAILGRDVPSEAVFSYAVSFAYIVLAFLSPLLSGIADYSGRRKYFMRLFTTVGALACMTLFFFDDADLVWLGTSAFILSTIGAAGSIVFYDSFLPQIASEDMMDKVSARGFAYGYAGSVILLIFCLFMINKPEVFGITSATLPSRISFALVGIWWIGFSQITFLRLPSDPIVKGNRMLMKGFHELAAVWNKLKKRKDILRFLAAFFFYSAGVQTVIYLATIFAQEELGFETSQLILTVLLLQIVAIIGAHVFARVSKAYGNKASLISMVVIWILICLGAYFVNAHSHFYVLASMVGMVLGGIQSLSRSTYAKLLEHMTDDLASYFSFYDVLSKLSLVVGAFLFGFVTHLTGSMRMSVLALSVLFIISLFALLTVDMRRMHRAGEGSTAND